MKWTLRAILTAVVLIFITAVSAQEMSRNQALCEQKGIVTTFSLEKRDQFTEAEMLEILRKDWEASLSKLFGHASYVDMQRIIRDNYRSFNGEYRITNDKDTIKKRMVREIYDCRRFGF